MFLVTYESQLNHGAWLGIAL